MAVLNIRQEPANAKQDNVTDDVPALIRAYEAVREHGGAEIYFPGGAPYLMASRPGKTTSNLKITTSNVWLRGDGPGLSILRKSDANHGGILRWEGTPENPIVGGGISGLELDGGSDRGNINGHAIRLQWVSNWVAERFWIHDVADYGIGAQKGLFRDIDIGPGRISRTGADAIDFKNNANGNRDNRLHRVTCEDWGLTAKSGQPEAAFDLRGEGWIGSDLIARTQGKGAGLIGFRMREGWKGHLHGPGAFEAQLSNCRYVIEDENAEGSIAYHMMHVRCGLANCNGFGAQIGAVFSQLEGQMVGGLMGNCGTGVWVKRDPELKASAARTGIIGVRVRGRYGEGEDGIVVADDDCLIDSNMVRSKNIGLRIDPEARGTHVGVNKLDGNVVPFVNRGSGTMRTKMEAA